MKISEELLETYADLSPEARRLLDFLQKNPEGMRPLAYGKAPSPKYPLLPWPTLIGKEKLEEIRRATVGVAALVQSIPERIFDNDPGRLAEYYGYVDPALTTSVPTPPNSLDKAFARGDFIDTKEGFFCVEMNMTANLGGMNLGFWESFYRRHPAIAEFLDQEKIQPFCRESLSEMFSQILEDVRQSSLETDDGFGVVMGVKPEGRALAEKHEPSLQRVYSQVLGRENPTTAGASHAGAFHIVHDASRFSVRSDRLYHDGRRVQGFIHYSSEPVSDEVRRCVEAGNLILYNTPQAACLSHKLSLALLSEHGESDLFDVDEKAVLRDHVPWCRRVDSGTADYQGETRPLPELLEKRRERFVLKESWGAGGADVFVGRYCSPEEWRRRVDDALREGSWIAQEFLTSRPYLFPSGEDDCSVHDVVWGMFCFGRRYGGGFLRMMPREDVDGAGMAANRGVVNAKLGAPEGLIFEV